MSDYVPRRLGDLLDINAATRGMAEAIVTSTTRIDHATLRAEARAVARSLLALGIGRGDHIGLLMGNDADWVRIFFGAALIGAVRQGPELIASGC